VPKKLSDPNYENQSLDLTHFSVTKIFWMERMHQHLYQLLACYTEKKTNYHEPTRNVLLTLASPFLSAIASKTSRECVCRWVSRRCCMPGKTLHWYNSPLGCRTFGDAPLRSRIFTSSLSPAVEEGKQYSIYLL